jgi:hypothetical protein
MAPPPGRLAYGLLNLSIVTPTNAATSATQHYKFWSNGSDRKGGDGEKGANWRGKKKKKTASAEELAMASEGMETDVQRYKSVWG